MMKKLPTFGLLIISATALAGDYKADPKLPSAELSIVAISDSTKVTMITTGALAHGDENCAAPKRGVGLGLDHARRSPAQTKPMRIVANELLVFTATYREARWAENRACSTTASFTPAADRRYLAKITTLGEVAECVLGVFDITNGAEELVDIHTTEFVCHGRKMSKVPNGKPYRDTMGPIFIYIPAR